MATWGFSQLDTTTLPNWDYFGQLYGKALDYGNQVKSITDEIGKLALEAPDTGGDVNLLSPGTLSTNFVMPTAPTFPDIHTADVPVMPSAPDMMLPQVTTVPLNTEIVAYIKTQLTSRLTYATGLTPDVELALFNRGRDRITTEANAAHDKALAGFASRGFSRPTGASLSVLEGFTKEALEKIGDVNREIIIKQAELEQANIHKVLDQFQALEALLLNEMGIADGNEVRLFQTKAEVLINQIKVLNEVNRLNIDAFLGQVQMFEAQGRLNVQQVEMLIKQYEVINGYNTALANIGMEKAKILNTYYLGKYGALTEGHKAVGTMLGQLSASLFNTMTYSVGWDWKTSWSGSTNVNGSSA